MWNDIVSVKIANMHQKFHPRSNIHTHSLFKIYISHFHERMIFEVKLNNNTYSLSTHFVQSNFILGWGTVTKLCCQHSKLCQPGMITFTSSLGTVDELPYRSALPFPWNSDLLRNSIVGRISISFWPSFNLKYTADLSQFALPSSFVPPQNIVLSCFSPAGTGPCISTHFDWI